MKTKFVKQLYRKCVGLYTTDVCSGDFIYVNEEMLKYHLTESDVFKKWGAILIDGEKPSHDVVLKLSLETEMKYVATWGYVLFNTYGEAGMLSTKYIPRKAHQSIYVWLLSYKPKPPKPSTSSKPVEPRKSKRLSNRRHKPNYRV